MMRVIRELLIGARLTVLDKGRYMKVVELIPFINEIENDTKIHFAKGGKNPEDALISFTNGSFKEWQEYQRNENFRRQYVLSLIWLGNDEWLYAGVYKVNGVKKHKDGHFEYLTSLTKHGRELIGKAVIHYKRQFRQSYCNAERYIDDFEVIEIKREVYSKPFPGYDKVSVSWYELASVINTESWKTGLSNQKGVYLITDTSNGKMYVGSATGNEMILGRWRSYVENGHGGNKELKKVSLKHIKSYFKYTILDVYKANTDDSIILEREQWWKEVLMTREHGFNKN